MEFNTKNILKYLLKLLYMYQSRIAKNCNSQLPYTLYFIYQFALFFQKFHHTNTNINFQYHLQ